MPYLSGEYDAKVDAKGRIVLPAKLKSKLPAASGNELVVTRGFEPCLVIYPMIEWKKIHNKVAGLNEFNPEFRKFQRNFFRGNTEVEFDTVGRFLVPKSMLRFASIEKEVVMVGIGNRIEVWDPEKYDDFLISDPNEFSELAQKYLAPDEE